MSKGGVRYMNSSMIDLWDGPKLENKSARHLAEVRAKKEKAHVQDFSFIANKLQQTEDRINQAEYRTRNMSGTGADLISPRLN